MCDILADSNTIFDGPNVWFIACYTTRPETVWWNCKYIYELRLMAVVLSFSQET